MRMSARTDTPPCVLLGGEAIAVSAARSLAKSGVHVYALGDASDPVRASRYCHAFVPTGSKEGVIERYLEWLEKREAPGAAILPCDDYGVGENARHPPPPQGRGYPPLRGGADLIAARVDQGRTPQNSPAGGVPTPRPAT